MCVWNCDDSLVITAQECQREKSIKVWNSKDGDLIHEFLVKKKFKYVCSCIFVANNIFITRTRIQIVLMY